MSGRPFYVTTPIYYVNDLPHLGHAYTTIACDVLARYKRMRGYDVMFLTGTDEHGQKIERKAVAEGHSPKEYVDRITAAFKDLWGELDISNDHFIRTTDAEHVQAVQRVFQRLYDAGDIYLGSYEGWYCTPCEAFFPEAQLKEGNCPDCGRAVEWLQEESYFFRLSKYGEPLLRHIEENPGFIQPASRRHEMVNFIKGGLEDLCVSRTTFTWGIPVPFAPGHVVYVWLDALTNYLTAIGYVDDPERFARYWPADVHVVGKEIVRFHSVIWPAVLMALGLPLPKCVFGHGWWTVEGEKMSKSKGNVIKPKEYADEFGVDAVRYFVLREAPFGQDADFSRMSFIYRVNADLANDLGNLLSRTTAMINKFAGGVVPAAGEWIDMDRAIPELAGEVIEKAADAFDGLDFQEGIAQVFRLVDAANKYVDEAAPWALARTDEGRRRLGTVLYNLAESLRIATVALSPVLIRKAVEIWAQLGLSGEPSDAGWDATRWGGMAPGTRISRGEPVFPRFDTKAEAASISTGKPADKPADGPSDRPSDRPSDEPAPLESDLIGIEDFARVDLRVATILEAERVSGSDKLVKIQVDLGQERRQIVAGIAQHYSPEELVGKQVIVVANLKPATLRGEVSNGMLLAASTAKGPRELSVLTLDRPIASGSKVK
ncbi:MAG TPA: methionine--tRNA ligase [Bacillota bacterium]|nr:methionine--tRNA ligase [Bacillota bacterium]HNY68324.1 methionine--tRNA ligase [Bacillota bacterium]